MYFKELRMGRATVTVQAQGHHHVYRKHTDVTNRVNSAV